MVEHTIAKRPGRPRKPGSIAFDRRTGAMRVFVGYCEHGTPVLVERDDIDTLVRWTRKEKKRWIVRFFSWFMHAHML